MFQKYLEAGFCVIPSKGGVPQVKWGKHQDTLPTKEEAESWDRLEGVNYELVCGKVSGVIALDIDTDDASLIAKVEAFAGVSPVKKFGSKGFTAFYRYNGEIGKSWGKDVELLSDKHLSCIPPSLHRKTGKPYIWLCGELIGAELPLLPDTFTALMDVLYPRKVYVQPTHHHNESVELEQAREMLDFISPDISRDEWIKVGMALRHEYGDFANHLWHTWSAGGKSYKPKDAQAAWRSFNGSGVGIGTLVYMARSGGFQFQQVVTPQVTIPEIKIEPIVIGTTNLVSEIADWITSTAMFPQPLLSLAAALAFVGMLKGHRIRGATNLRTNLLVLSLAATGSGKEYPQYCINQLADSCGLDSHMMGEPTSGAGLLTGINKGQSVSLLVLDEIGRFIGNISLKNAGGFQREIVDYMVKLFSSANRTFRGKQYANEKDNPQITLHQPHFCCLGSTVKNKLQAACTSSEVIDGFLNRWLVFHAEERPEEIPGMRYKEPPADLIQRIGEYIEANPIKYASGGKPEPKEVRITPEAYDRLKAFKKAMIKKIDNEPYPINQLYARSGEHVEKIAMVLCDEDIIGIIEIQAAINIVEQSNLNICDFTSMISDNQHESDLLKILNVIKKHKNITRNQLTQKTRSINHKIRNDIIIQLLDAEEITQTKNAQKIIYSIHNIEMCNV